jgi:hypothetical protein
MRRALGLLAVGVLFLRAAAAHADDREAALAVVDQAVKAHGGERALAKTQYVHRVGKGALFLFGEESPFTVDTTMHLPDRLRDTVESERSGQKNRLTIVLNGDKGWRVLGANRMEMDKSAVADLREELYVVWLVLSLPLKDRAFTLAAPAPANVLGKPATSLKVTAANRPEATLFFDKESGLLIKVERPAKQAGLAFKKEYFLADHKDFDGVKLPTRWLEVVNGNKATDLTVSAYDFPSRIDESLLEKP